jgi:hypothetical protein
MESVILPFCLIGTIKEEIMRVDVGQRRRVWIWGFNVHTLTLKGALSNQTIKMINRWERRGWGSILVVFDKQVELGIRQLWIRFPVVIHTRIPVARISRTHQRFRKHISHQSIEIRITA